MADGVVEKDLCSAASSPNRFYPNASALAPATCVLDLLQVVVRALNSGEHVTVVIGIASEDAELTSQQMADVLNVGRPYVVKLAKTGELPFRMVGNRHRFATPDVLAYRQLLAHQRSRALEELSPAGGYQTGDF